jgi:hypothetical protein
MVVGLHIHIGSSMMKPLEIAEWELRGKMMGAI